MVRVLCGYNYIDLLVLNDMIWCDFGWVKNDN